MNKTSKRDEIAELWGELERGGAGAVLEKSARPAADAPQVERTLRALALYEAGRHGEAVKTLDGVLKSDPENPVAQLFLVLALFKAGDRRRAGERLLNHTIILPHPLWLEDFVRTFWPLRFTTALGAPDPLPPAGEWRDPNAAGYEKWKALAQDEPGGPARPGSRRLAEKYARQAESRYLVKDLARALLLMERAREMNPGDENVLTNLAYLYLLTGRREQAIALLDPEMEKRLALYREKEDPMVLPHMELLVCYAWAVHEQGNHEQALRLLSSVHPEGPEDLGAYFVASVCWLMLGRDQEFRQTFRIATTRYFIDTWEQLLVPFIHRVGAWLIKEDG